ncbi:MAG: haloalkane dehalogenase [Paraglaciecola psychrophila]|jgi:haloalkane dehalogenase
MKFKRTPDNCFDNLPDYSFAPNYVQLDDGEGGELRMHYIDEGPADAEVVLLMHGQPAWSYLYRKMVPLFVAAGYRVIAPDLIGFGKSDKPTLRENYTYARHVAWVTSLLTQKALSGINLFCQDWGGLIGLRVAAENADRFARIVVANTGLPDAQGVAAEQFEEASKPMQAYYDSLPVAANVLAMGMAMAGDSSGMGFMHWVKYCSESTGFSPQSVLTMSNGELLSEAEQKAYGAPFPDESYLAGGRQFPSLVPIFPDNVAIADNRAAWAVFEQWQKPMLCAFSDSDPVTAGGEKRFMASVPGAQGQPHTTIKGAGHFLQEHSPVQLAQLTITFIQDNPQ